jgi:hypothetical protein
MHLHQQLVGDLVYALDITNLFRVKAKLPVIEALPKGIRSDAKECIMARAFNFDCHVGYAVAHQPWYRAFLDRRAYEPGDDEAFSDGGYVVFAEEGIARALAGEMNSEAINTDTFGDDDSTNEYGWVVPLRDEIARVAKAFDDEGLTEWELVEYDDLGEFPLGPVVQKPEPVA